MCCERAEAASSCLVYWFASRISVCVCVCVRAICLGCAVYMQVSVCIWYPSSLQTWTVEKYSLLLCGINDTHWKLECSFLWWQVMLLREKNQSSAWLNFLIDNVNSSLWRRCGDKCQIVALIGTHRSKKLGSWVQRSYLVSLINGWFTDFGSLLDFPNMAMLRPTRRPVPPSKKVFVCRSHFTVQRWTGKNYSWKTKPCWWSMFVLNNIYDVCECIFTPKQL